MPFTTSAKNTMLGSIAPTHVSLHSADPGQTGTSELTGGAYARVAGTFNAAAAGARALNEDVTLNVPASTTVAFVGYWTAITGGTFLGSFDVVNEVYASAGTYVVTATGTSLSIADA